MNKLQIEALRGAIIFIIASTLIFVIVRYSLRGMCNNHCTTDKQCAEMCWKRGYCPFGDRP